jgi:hypothetical protein
MICQNAAIRDSSVLVKPEAELLGDSAVANTLTSW